MDGPMTVRAPAHLRNSARGNLERTRMIQASLPSAGLKQKGKSGTQCPNTQLWKQGEEATIPLCVGETDPRRHPILPDGGSKRPGRDARQAATRLGVNVPGDAQAEAAAQTHGHTDTMLLAAVRHPPPPRERSPAPATPTPYSSSDLSSESPPGPRLGPSSGLPQPTHPALRSICWLL